MAEELVMPRLSDTMEQGTIARWLKQEGDQVTEGDVLAEIETDKATMELNSYADGVLLKILVGDGESAALGAPIAIVGEEGESVDGGGGNGSAETAEAEPEATEEPKAEAAEAEKPQKEPEKPAAGANGAGSGTLKASPIARRMAGEAGIDLRSLAGKGSGPDGRIVKVDVERLISEGQGGDAAPARQEAPAAEAKPAAQAAPAGGPASDRYPDAEVVAPSSMLKTVARRMAEAKSTVPHFYLSDEIDMTAAFKVRKDLNAALADSGEKVSVNDLVLRACVAALLDHQQFHRSWVDGQLVYHKHVGIGIAVALDDGLIVPVIKNAETKGIRQLAREARDLATRARDGKLRQHEIEGGTFTVSNLGMFGIPNFGAIINPPEPGILAVGAAVQKPVVVDGEVVVRPIMGVTLSVDHRSTSGADGARFLQSVKRYLEGGLLLLG
jgi:pyruvate dehydrogenase E2 component (dihydrolipoamide acetyltransferase)